MRFYSNVYHDVELTIWDLSASWDEILNSRWQLFKCVLPL